ncbi:RND superfamily putative drug exporter [Kribbella orskensis]|uniref:RND superfamily putative drug exporter n=1 Tax=Kribbella orskensis TaxID=2512216 RepID=A0ABY2BA84_9ACTN|nr:MULTISPECIES: MMPL family transporter [Kribbella]TCN32244.1 RND superfamily putative drug exporter [Kribbella sp. VKM Ac-2500]TCO12661.1 RND superfamily putative drug exporter [Kribbella orskensis]
MLHRLGTFIAHRAKPVLLITALLLIAAGVVGFGAFGKLAGGGFDDPGAESTRAATALADKFDGQADLVFVVDAGRSVDEPAVAKAGTELTRRISAEPDLTGVASYWSTKAPAMRSEDGAKALVVASISGDFDSRTEIANRLISTYGGEHDGLTVNLGGEVGVNHDVNAQVGRDLALAEAIAVPIILALLVLAFGSVVAALLPLAVGAIAIFGTFAELALLGSATDVSIYAVNLTTALGLGLSIDYALLMVSRYREELGKGADVQAAVVRTVETAGRTIVFSALTVAVALAALLLFPLFFLRSFAYAGIGVIVIAMVGALVVLPALLTVLGHRVNAGRLPWAKGAPKTEAPFWGRLAALAMRRPGLTALPVLAGLLLLATPLLHVEFGTPDDRVLPTTASSRVVGDALRDDFGSDDTNALNLISAGPVATSNLPEYAVKLSSLPDVVRVESAAGTFAGGRQVAPANPRLVADGVQRLAVVTEADSRSAEARQLVDSVRALPGPGEFLVGGNTARFMDSQHAIGSRLPLAGGMIALTTFVLLFLFTGSLLQPLRALLLNMIGLSATLGAMVLIFQDGRLSGWLGFTPLPLDTSMLVLLFCIAFGLSMDYEVFVLSRIKEQHDEGATLTDSVTTGLARSGRIVSMAAVILSVSFFAFGTSSVSFIQLFGIGSGLAVLIDATLIRGILVPAAFGLMGRWAWWSPAPLRTLHTRIGLTESTPG